MTPQDAEQLSTRVVEAHMCWLLDQRPARDTALAAEFRALRPALEGRPQSERYQGEKRDMRGKRWERTA